MYKRLWIPILALVTMLSALATVAATASKPGSLRKAVPKTSTSKAAAKPAKSQPRRAGQPKALPKLLDLGADKCIPCKMMFPVLDEMSKSYKGKLAVEFIDVWKNPGAKDKYKIKVIPTQILYNSNGKEVFRHEGYFPKEDILAEFKKHGIRL